MVKFRNALIACLTAAPGCVTVEAPRYAPGCPQALQASPCGQGAAVLSQPTGPGLAPAPEVNPPAPPVLSAPAPVEGPSETTLSVPNRWAPVRRLPQA